MGDIEVLQRAPGAGAPMFGNVVLEDTTVAHNQRVDIRVILYLMEAYVSEMIEIKCTKTFAEQVSLPQTPCQGESLFCDSLTLSLSCDAVRVRLVQPAQGKPLHRAAWAQEDGSARSRREV